MELKCERDIVLYVPFSSDLNSYNILDYEAKVVSLVSTGTTQLQNNICIRKHNCSDYYFLQKQKTTEALEKHVYPVFDKIEKKFKESGGNYIINKVITANLRIFEILR